MPQSPDNAPEAAESPAKWLSTSEAAARLGVSERTVARWAKARKIEAQKIAGEKGAQWLVLLPQNGELKTDLKTGADNLKTHCPHVGGTLQNNAQTPQNGEISPDVRTGAAIRADNVSLAQSAPDYAAQLLAQVQSENAFLRGVIEQLQRDGAETRAALRAALANGAKALPTARTDDASGGEILPMESREKKRPANAPESPQNGATGRGTGNVSSAHQRPEFRRETGSRTARDATPEEWAAAYASIAEELGDFQ